MDLFNLADTQFKTQVFYQSGIWYKPRGISMIHITCIGSGGGGGGANNVTLGTASFGGGGGGSGGVSQLTIPAIFLSDVLKITVGLGGAGGNPGVTGTAGGVTIVETQPGGAITPPTYICYANAGSGGQLGTTAGSGAGGAGGAVIGATAALSLSSGIFSTQAGITGGASASSAAGVSTTNQGFRTASTGGGGKDASNVGFSGGTVLSGLYAPEILGGLSGTTGNAGFFSSSPFTFTGGSGGGASGSGAGGTGGAGIICGGGGGGGAGVTGSFGGRGGNGLVIISCW